MSAHDCGVPSKHFIFAEAISIFANIQHDGFPFINWLTMVFRAIDIAVGVSYGVQGLSSTSRLGFVASSASVPLPDT